MITIINRCCILNHKQRFKSKDNRNKNELLMKILMNDRHLFECQEKLRDLLQELNAKHLPM